MLYSWVKIKTCLKRGNNSIGKVVNFKEGLKVLDGQNGNSFANLIRDSELIWSSGQGRGVQCTTINIILYEVVTMHGFCKNCQQRPA